MTKRPTRNDPEVLKAAAAVLAPRFHQWLGSDRKHYTVDECAKALADAMDGYEDGYEIAKRLEDGGWSPDAALVDILEMAVFHKSNAHKKACEAWVSANHVQPIPIESKVRWARQQPDKAGLVVENYPEGKARVIYADMGQVRQGIGSNGFIIEWEDLEVLPS